MMKALLGALICLVFTMTQTFAISGGPWGRPGQTAVTGTYAGAFVPPLAGSPPAESDNSLGLFTVTIPKTGVGTGTIAIFRNGHFYSGTIQATADPDSARLYATLNATFTLDDARQFSVVIQPGGPPPPPQDFGGNCNADTTTIIDLSGTITRITTLTCTFTYSANGKISQLHGVTIQSESSIFNSTTARLRGRATLDYSTDNPMAPPTDTATVSYKVVGFKQAELSQ
jgi:hypothetical protein